MSRATWKWSAAVGLSIAIVATALWWPERSVNTSTLPESTAADAKEVAALQALLLSNGKTPLQADPEQLPEVLRDGFSPESQPVARLGVDLADISWRPLFNYLDDSQYPPVYDDLKSRAENGDPNAAFFLWEGLQYCQRNGPPPMSESEFSEELRMIREDHQVPQYHNGERRVVDISEINMPAEAAAIMAQHNFEQCNYMPVENRGEGDYWKDFANLNGSRVATSVVAMELAQNGDPSALEDMWKDGDPMALSSLSGFHTKQYEAGMDPAGLTKSFAYWLSFREMYYASRQAAGPDTKPFFGGIEITTNRLREQLLPGQIAEAEDIATDILRNRTGSCCISMDVPK